MIEFAIDRDVKSWRAAARAALAREVPPDQVVWRAKDEALLPIAGAITPAEGAARGSRPRVPASFVPLCEAVACHRDAQRWSLMYRVLWRLTHGEPNLLEISVDPDVHQMLMMEKVVRRDRHKMTAFVRFREVREGGDVRYVAWYRPEHFVLRLATPHFVDRYAAMKWAILTPDESAIWDGSSLGFAPGLPRRAAPAEDELEDLWKTYYANIFNPSRLSVNTMRAEMPKRFWDILPEAELIPGLVRGASERVTAMTKTKAAPASATPFVPRGASLPQLRQAAQTCQGCELYCYATQTVFGVGPANSPLVLIGEQPGDQEDRAGVPFVGPAGQLLNEVLEEVGIDRQAAYLTNVVKHFKFEQRGTRRMHSTPSARDASACFPWLEAELGLIKPPLLVCLGSTAAKAIISRGFSITRERGVARQTPWSPWTLATWHPSALLRIPDESMRQQAREQFTTDLRLVAGKLREVA